MAVGLRILERWRIKVVLPHIQGRLLDLGCGYNRLVAAYSEPGVGADIYPWPSVNVVCDVARLPFASEAVNTVTLLASLNHITHRHETLREILWVLQPNGRVLITMIPPGIGKLWHWLGHLFRWDKDFTVRGLKEGEVFGISRKVVDRLLEQAGFVIVDHRSFMFGFNTLTIAEKASSRDD